MFRAIVLGAAAVALALSAPVAAATPIEINAILSLTGSASFLGSKEAQALGVLESVVNRTGVRGRPVHFAIYDDQSNPQVTVQLANSIVAKRAAVILGPSIFAMCAALAPLVEKEGPVEYCLSPVIRGAAGGFIFTTSTGASDIAAVQARFYREHGWTRIAQIVSTDATGQNWDREFAAALALPENQNLKIVAHEHFNPTDISVAAQIARIKAANPQAAVAITTGTALGNVLRAFNDAGMDVPISTTAGNMIAAQLAQYTAFLPKQLYFPATRGVVPDPGLGRGPIRDAQKTYFDAFRIAGIKPDQADTLTWDPAMIVIEAMRALGPDVSADRLRTYIGQLHGWAGIVGIYDFRDGSQRGIGQNAMIIYRWDAGRGEPVVASRSAGRLK
jgi:branched-chain amino acid transport system substrate-binding protein